MIQKGDVVVLTAEFKVPGKERGVVFDVEHRDYDDEYDFMISEISVRWFPSLIEEKFPLETYKKNNEGYSEGEDPPEKWWGDYLEVVTPKRYVNVYLIDRAFGGPEEGGWWYNTRTPVEEECVYCQSDAVAESTFERLSAWCDEQNSKRNSNISSVLSEGQYVVAREAWPAEYSPASRPRYE